ncbi:MULTISPECIES: MAB_1171c family putative transporter [Streptomyces]|uniref:MAB_1171c family putative transporter n=1 Tax=Streptomyces TaxID=1883 RepID=UPI001F474AA8|nr:MAB_1171c family putative transporter [Streptomyces noursei]MCE4946731.1 hypothetical protein [Streptomyces noursei]
MPSKETAYDLAYTVVGLSLYLLALYKGRAWLSERIPSLLLMTGAALSAGSGFLVAAPHNYRLIDQLAGVSNLATYVVYSAITVCCAFYLLIVMLWKGASANGGSSATSEVRRQAEIDRLRRAARWVAPLYAVILMLMTVLFFTVELPTGERPLDFDTTYAEQPTITAFLMIYQAGYGLGIWSMAYFAWRHSRRMTDRLLRTSLTCTAIGCVFVAMYGVLKIIAIVGVNAGLPSMEPISNTLAPAAASVGGDIVLYGWVYSALKARRHRNQEFHALEILWRTVTRIDPGLILKNRVPRSEWGQQVMAVRRAGEIRDGQLSLRPWVSPDVVDTARRIAEDEDLRPSQREALAAAAALRAALRAREEGTVPSPACDHLPGIEVPPHAERQHLIMVGKYLHSALVDKVLAASP